MPNLKLANEFLNSKVGRRLTLLNAQLTYPKMWSAINIEGYNVCNLHCKMCPYEIMTRKKELMPLGTYDEILHRALDVGIRTVNLNIYNESLLDPLLFDRVIIAKRNGMTVQFTTNGTLLMQNGNIPKIVREKVDTIYVSLDAATKETYERLRLGAIYEETLKGVLQLIKDRESVKVIPVLTVQRENAGEVEEFKSYWSQFGVETQTWAVDNRRGGASLSRPYSRVWHKPLPCRKLFDELNVLSNGEVALCCLDYDGKYQIGNIKTQSVEDIRRQSRYVRRLHLEGRGDEIGLCTSCDALRTGGLYWWHRKRVG